jgi:hypothetical protein
MEAVCVSETSVPTHQTTRCNNPDDRNIIVLATVYPLEYSGIWDSCYGVVGLGNCMGKKCYSPQCVHIGCGAHPALVQWIPGLFLQGAYYSGIKIFNNLPLEIKNVAGDQKKFKIALKEILYS